MRRSGTRVDGGKLKVNENGEVYIERRGRKPGARAKNAKSSSAGRLAAGGRRASMRNGRKGSEPSARSDLAAIYLKYASRRSQLFKANCPSRSPYARVCLPTRESVWHKDILYRVGDVVKVLDDSDGLFYFGQIRGFVTDPLVNHYVALTWLVPKHSAPDPHVFDPEHFAHAVVDNKNYPLEACTWVQSRPSQASYHEEWSNRRVVSERNRKELIERNRQLRAVAEEELRRYDQTPLVDLTTRKNEEPR